jgi:hypothetical protein
MVALNWKFIILWAVTVALLTCVVLSLRHRVISSSSNAAGASLRLPSLLGRLRSEPAVLLNAEGVTITHFETGFVEEPIALLTSDGGLVCLYENDVSLEALRIDLSRTVSEHRPDRIVLESRVAIRTLRPAEMAAVRTSILRMSDAEFNAHSSPSLDLGALRVFRSRHFIAQRLRSSAGDTEGGRV